jgi:alkylation response protein AidB-like acyl-CoA dehydrogenase
VEIDDAGTSSVHDFRRELEEWLEANLTAEVVAAGRQMLEDEHSFELLRSWNRTLADAGWAAPTWPAEYGGRNATVDQQLAYFEAMAAVDAPGPVNVIGVANIAPAILEAGTQEQKDRFLGPMLRGDEIWCQGMSEPDAGSDLGSLRTSAVLDGDEFVINGQKTWNSLGQFADWCQLYVRTDPSAAKHAGISCLLVDMRLPGIEVRPLRTMTGEVMFSELYFTDVRVPATALLGTLDAGWKVAMATLSYERAGVAKLHLGLSARFDELVEETRRSGIEMTPVHRDRLIQLYCRIACLRWSTSRELEAVGRGGRPSPAMGSLTKLMWAEASQELSGVALGLLGQSALGGPWGKGLLGTRGNSIAGGTTEINRNIVAEHGLGLPR